MRFLKRNLGLNKANYYLDKGISDLKKEKYKESFQSFVDAAILFQKNNIKEKEALCFVYMGIIIYKVFKPPQPYNALKCLERALEIFGKENDKKKVGDICYLIHLIFHNELKDEKKAFYFQKKALEIGGRFITLDWLDLPMGFKILLLYKEGVSKITMGNLHSDKFLEEFFGKEKKADVENWRIREAANKALGEVAKSNPDEVFPILRELAKDENWRIREAAAEALGEVVKSNPDEVFPILKELAKDENRRVRETAAKSLRVSGFKGALPDSYN